MSNKYIISSILVLAFAACSTPRSETESKATTGNDADSLLESEIEVDQNDYEAFQKLETYLIESIGVEPLIIDSSCAILINPSMEQLKKMEEESGEDFYTIADDNSYYQSEASMKLDSLKIKTVFVDVQFLKLVGNKDSWLLDLRKEGAPPWNLILFNREKNPEIIYAIDLTTEKLSAYFNE